MLGCLPIRILLGPSGTESSSSQASTQQSVGVQGGTAVGAQNSGTAGNSGVTTTGSGNHITVTSSDPATVQAALDLGATSVVASANNANNALTALEQIEANATTSTNLALASNANVSTGALQYGAGQTVGQAVPGNSPFSTFTPTELGIGALALLALLIFAAKGNR